MVDQKVQDTLKKFQDTTSKKLEKTQTQLNEQREDFNKHQHDTQDTIKKEDNTRYKRRVEQRYEKPQIKKIKQKSWK
jgi:predicted RNA-binding protein